MTTPDLDFESPDALRDPYPLYRHLLELDKAPLHPGLNGICLARYTDVQGAFRDERLSSNRFGPVLASLPPEVARAAEPLARSLRHWTLFLDPPRHTQLRRLINQGFTPRLVRALEPRIRQVVDELLDAVVEKESFDAVADLAYPLPAIVIAEMLGLPVEDRDRLKHWSQELLYGLSTVPEIERLGRAQAAVVEMQEYFGAIVRARREEPREDIISALVAARDEGEPLSDEELVATCIMLLFGGHETTTNLIANGLLTLLRHPEAVRDLRADPALLEGAVEEVLRYESPVQRLSRSTAAPVELGGHALEAGRRVVLFLAAANRDPRRFEDPDRFDIHRRDNRHLAFGYGIHFCVGATLGRLEGRLAFGAVLDRFADLELLVDEPEWHETTGVRALRRLPIAARPA